MKCYNNIVEDLVSIINAKTQNQNKPLFRLTVCYFLAKLASSLRLSVNSKTTGKLPVNLYVISLATSGFGKNHSVNILEDLLEGFQEDYEDMVLPELANINLNEIALKRATLKGTDINEELASCVNEFESGGAIPFTFDSGTVPAVKQLRHKLLMANSGAINAQMDEIGSNLSNAQELLALFLELYDLGLVKQKLIKNTSDNPRSKELRGGTPTNLLMFGTPSKVFDGSTVEDLFMSLLETGYARRCFFAYGVTDKSYLDTTPEQLYRNLTNTNSTTKQEYYKDYFKKFATIEKANQVVEIDETTAIALLRYRLDCERLADNLPEHMVIAKAELSHRHFKTMKLAALLAFIDGSANVSLNNLNQAITIAEESGEVFKQILNQDKPYMRLAKYLVSCGQPQTHADLLEALPFYKSTTTARNELMALAIAWGYRHYILIKKTSSDSVDFFEAEPIKENDLNSLIVSYSQNLAENYKPELVPFSKFPQLFAHNINWCTHWFTNKYREEDKAQAGFNLVVFDIDKGNLALTKELLAEYTYIIHTTKRHTELENRFRLVFPTSHTIKLNKDDFTKFMKNVANWLPIQVDSQTFQRSRKWSTHPEGKLHINEGKLLDVLQFIPNTSRGESNKPLQSSERLKEWLKTKVLEVGRNNTLLKYGLALLDNGETIEVTIREVKDLNNSFDIPLDTKELNETVMTTLRKRSE